MIVNLNTQSCQTLFNSNYFDTVSRCLRKQNKTKKNNIYCVTCTALVDLFRDLLDLFMIKNKRKKKKKRKGSTTCDDFIYLFIYLQRSALFYDKGSAI